MSGTDYQADNELPYAGDLDLADLWARFTSVNFCAGKQEKFWQYLKTLVSDPDAIDEVAFCDNCREPSWEDKLSSAAGGQRQICDSCWNDWPACDCCEEKFPEDDLYRTLGGSDICDSCRDNHYSYCEHCDGYYPDNDDGDHAHGDGCCDSPQPEFKIHNDGCEPLANDTQVTVTLPAGTISAEGLKEIRSYLQYRGHFDVSHDLDKIGHQWQAKGGNFTKRLSRYAYQAYQAKLTPEVLSRVGCIARDHSNAASVTIEVSRELNRDAAYWYHEDSCWWGGYSESRCTLKTNGGFGLRSFDGYGNVSGRAWVMPLRLDERGHLTQTFDTMTPDAFVVFNGYGDLSGYASARVMAHMAGWTYRKITFDCEPMYINAGGYLIAPEHIAENYAGGILRLSASQHSDLFYSERHPADA